MRAFYWFLFITFSVCHISSLADPAHPAPATFGNASVEKVVNIDSQLTIFCNIKDFPAIIGQNMPVKIKGINIPTGSTINSKTHMFLVDLLSLSTKDKSAKSITLKNIQRGQSFCLIAEMHINGQDLCDILIDAGLATRMIRIPTTTTANAAANPTPQTTTTQTISLTGTKPQLSTAGFIASKSSKVFHQLDCYHCKHIDESKAVYFDTREQALKSGRRPCKTCNP